MKRYAQNNYNAYQTLLDMGYAETTARAEAKDVLTRANRVVNERMGTEITDPKDNARNVLELLGYSVEDVVNELKKVIEQDKDFTNKLKAMSPALRHVGLQLDDTEKQVAPQLNVTVERVENTAQQGPEIPPEDI